jgi:hypothetical protein
MLHQYHTKIMLSEKWCTLAIDMADPVQGFW